ncbi:MAG TPA: hypothetical protein VM760_08310 [Sphingomicrobium sp.]|nr:hypothetical protein [Sphingomicrobium sp.]
MRSEVDIDAAVRSGIIGEDQASALRNLTARQSGASAATMERFEVPTSLTDIMSAVGIALLGMASVPILGMAPILAVPGAWALLWAGRRSTIERGRTASAFVLFFVYCVAISLAGLVGAAYFTNTLGNVPLQSSLGEPAWLMVVGVLVTSGCWIWWRWTKLPIAVAAGWVAAMNLVTNAIRLAVAHPAPSLVDWCILGWGLVLLIVAMSWDFTDIRRETIRSRVAFWCHAAAGFFISTGVLRLLAPPSASAAGWMSLYEHNSAELDPAFAGIFLLFFLACLAVSLLIDRRSLIFATLWQAFVALMMIVANLPLALAATGGLLLALGHQWQRLRRVLLNLMPIALRAQLPRPDIDNPDRRPTRRHQEFGGRQIGSAPPIA